MFLTPLSSNLRGLPSSIIAKGFFVQIDANAENLIDALNEKTTCVQHSFQLGAKWVLVVQFSPESAI